MEAMRQKAAAQDNEDEESKHDGLQRDEDNIESESEAGIDLFNTTSKGGKDDVDVEFELVIPHEAYYHSVRAHLGQYLDGEDQESLDLSGLANNVVECVSIGSCIASCLDPNPEEDPKYKDLNDEDF